MILQPSFVQQKQDIPHPLISVYVCNQLSLFPLLFPLYTFATTQKAEESFYTSTWHMFVCGSNDEKLVDSPHFKGS